MATSSPQVIASQSIDENTLPKQLHTSDFVDSPVLCYIKGILGKRPNGLIQQTLCNFYSEDELDNAKNQFLKDNDAHLQDLPSNVRARHKAGLNKAGQTKKTMDSSDLLCMFEMLDKKGCLPSTPVYVTSTVLRIPGEDPDDNNPRIFQSEVRALRDEIKQLREDLTNRLAAVELQLRAVEQRPLASTQAQITSQSSQSRPTGNNVSAIRVEDRLCYFGKLSPLSNFFPSTVEIDYVTYATSEQAFQHKKALLAGNQTIADEIMKSPDPANAKKLGNSVSPPETFADDWDNMLIQIMEDVCTQKFLQNEAPRKYLLKTNDLHLVEGSRDPFWGCGHALTDPAIKNVNHWTGNNEMGKILKEVRSKPEIINTNSSSFNITEPVFNLDCFAATAFPAMAKEGGPSEPHAKPSFAHVLQNEGKWNLVRQLKNRNTGRTTGCNNGTTTLKGVKRISYVDFYVGQLEESTSTKDFEEYLTSAGITSTLCHKLTSQIPNSAAFRFRCEASKRETVLDSNTWPSDVIVRSWIRKPRIGPLP